VEDNLHSGVLKVRAATQIALDVIDVERRVTGSKVIVVVVVQDGGSLGSVSIV
jgi:hypothetical protein